MISLQLEVDIDVGSSRDVDGNNIGFSSLLMLDKNELRKSAASFGSSFLAGDNDRRRTFSTSSMKKSEKEEIVRRFNNYDETTIASILPSS